MLKPLLLAAAAVTLSSAVALAAGNADLRAAPRHAAHHKAITAKPIYDYAPDYRISQPIMPLLLGVAY